MDLLVISKILDLGFAALEAGMERKAIVDQMQALEANGATPEQVMEALQNLRKAAHADLSKELGQSG